jgi:2,4-dienoyl-CoA reductase-like NADH-dependent reductase (Old Yellow Enzyme family)/thioredoxin reductase
MLEKVFEPIEIKSMTLKNRIAFAPLLNMPRDSTDLLTAGVNSDLTVRWFVERAKGEAGLLVTGAVTTGGILGAGKKEGFARLGKAVHEHGSKICVQLAAFGPLGTMGPSPHPYPDPTHPKWGVFDLEAGQIIPVSAMPVPVIKQTEREFAEAAAVLKSAGIDAVELHCAHGGATLHCSFLTPFHNRRTDQYGGSWENRLRLTVETLQLMREAVGKDFPILVRLSVDEMVGPAGITTQDTCEIIVPALEKAGADCIDASQGSITHAPEGINITCYHPRGCFIQYAEAVKKATRLPVIGVGRIVDLEMAEAFLQEGKADIIYMGRQLTADPETVKKYREGRPEDVRKCIGELTRRQERECGRPCIINYDIQDEPIPLKPAEKPKKVLVIGGGVAGMEAARIAAQRGHKVTLMERDTQLGGEVSVLALNPLTSEFRNIVEYLGTQMRKLKVDVRLCREAGAADVKEMKPDVVILAAGSEPVIPEVAQGKPGVMTHEEASKHPSAVGQRVIVWNFWGAELAITLAQQGKSVVLIGRGGPGSLASEHGMYRKWWLVRRLTDVSVVRATPESHPLPNLDVLSNVEVEDIRDSAMKIKDKSGKTRLIPYDTIILSQRYGRRKRNDSLFDELQGKVPEVHKIGDCSQVREIQDAIWSANEVARRI